jgi:hypothetical protein
VIAVIAIGAIVALASLAGLLFLLHRRHTVFNKILESLHTTSEYVDQPSGSPKEHELLGSSAEHEVHAESRGSRMSEFVAELLPEISKLGASPLPNILCYMTSNCLIFFHIHDQVGSRSQPGWPLFRQGFWNGNINRLVLVRYNLVVLLRRTCSIICKNNFLGLSP